MRLIREKEVPGRDIKVLVKELELHEIRAWLAERTQPDDLIDSMLLEDASVSDLLVLTDISPENLERLAPSEIKMLLDEAKEINEAFFVMREKIVAIGQKILAAPPA